MGMLWRMRSGLRDGMVDHKGTSCNHIQGHTSSDVMLADFAPFIVYQIMCILRQM